MCDEVAVFTATAPELPTALLEGLLHRDIIGYNCDGEQCQLLSNCSESAFDDGGKDVIVKSEFFC